MKSYNIAVIPGDGTGPEVVREGVKVLDAVSKKSGFASRNGRVLIFVIFCSSERRLFQPREY